MGSKSARSSRQEAEKAAQKAIQAAQSYVRRSFKQFSLFTRAELDAGAAEVADHYFANQRNRTLAAKFLIITTALNDCPQGYQPSVIKRYFLLPGSTEHCIRQFLADDFDLSGYVSDRRMLALIETGRRRR